MRNPRDVVKVRSGSRVPKPVWPLPRPCWLSALATLSWPYVCHGRRRGGRCCEGDVPSPPYFGVRDFGFSSLPDPPPSNPVSSCARLYQYTALRLPWNGYRTRIYREYHVQPPMCRQASPSASRRLFHGHGQSPPCLSANHYFFAGEQDFCFILGG